MKSCVLDRTVSVPVNLRDFKGWAPRTTYARTYRFTYSDQILLGGLNTGEGNFYRVHRAPPDKGPILGGLS